MNPIMTSRLHGPEGGGEGEILTASHLEAVLYIYIYIYLYISTMP